MKLHGMMEKFVGEKVAVICSRFQYRGVLSEVGDDYVILAHATAVEDSGSASRDAPVTEDAISSSIFIHIDSIELFYQPNWCHAPLPSEK